MAIKRTCLARARKAVGYTQEGLAERLGVDRSTIVRWELGNTAPQPWLQPRLAGVLGVSAAEFRELLEEADRAEAGTTPAPDNSVRSTSRPAVTVEGSGSPGGADGGGDVHRKVFLRIFTGSVAGLAFGDPIGDFVGRAWGTWGDGASLLVGQADIDQIKHVTRLLASQDHLFGGRLSAQAAVTQLADATVLLDGHFATEAVQQQLFSAVSDLADTVAGMCFDAGLYPHAERCFRFAVECAAEFDDWSIRAKALSGLANLAVHTHRADDALSFAEMALVRSDRLTPLVSSVIHSRHARALGAAGAARGTDCVSAIRRAEDCFAAANNDEPPWITYYSQARLERDCGRALLGLALSGGDYAEAQQHLHASVDSFPSGHSRGKALAVANLATLTMARDDPLYAVQLGNNALAAANGIRSERVSDALRQLRQASVHHQAVPEVRDLTRQLDLTTQRV